MGLGPFGFEALGSLRPLGSPGETPVGSLGTPPGSLGRFQMLANQAFAPLQAGVGEAVRADAWGALAR